MFKVVAGKTQSQIKISEGNETGISARYNTCVMPIHFIYWNRSVNMQIKQTDAHLKYLRHISTLILRFLLQLWLNVGNSSYGHSMALMIWPHENTKPDKTTSYIWKMKRNNRNNLP